MDAIVQVEEHYNAFPTWLQSIIKCDIAFGIPIRSKDIVGIRCLHNDRNRIFFGMAAWLANYLLGFGQLYWGEY